MVYEVDVSNDNGWLLQNAKVYKIYYIKCQLTTWLFQQKGQPSPDAVWHKAIINNGTQAVEAFESVSKCNTDKSYSTDMALHEA